MRAKFRCNTVKFSGDPTDPNASRTYELTAVYDDGTEENRRFNRYTPYGQLQITVDNPDAKLTVGEMYYLDFTPCNPTEAAAWRGEETVEDHSRDVPQPTIMGNTHQTAGVYTPGHAATEDAAPADTDAVTATEAGQMDSSSEPAQSETDADAAGEAEQPVATDQETSAYAHTRTHADTGTIDGE